MDKQASKTLLVIGNGFDLHLKAKTKYEQFFDSSFFKERKEACFDWIRACKKDLEGHKALASFNMLNAPANCWDLFFCLMSPQYSEKQNTSWCDIETEIYNSLQLASSSFFSWERVQNLIVFPNSSFDNDSLRKHDTDERIMALYLEAKGWGPSHIGDSSFYDKLLNELECFEKLFGEYISNEVNTDTYICEARSLVDVLCDVSQGRIMIDSFNYSDFSDLEYPIRHINGDCANPIFGVDLKKNGSHTVDQAFPFSKTYRRLKQDAAGLRFHQTDDKTEISRAVVFGHSLNPMDYDYFHYLFTLLGFNSLDLKKMGHIEFVFNVYDQDKKYEIIKGKIDSIYALLNQYEDTISESKSRVLINLLRFSGKMTIREI